MGVGREYVSAFLPKTGGVQMRRAVLVVLVVGMAVLLSGTALAATASDVATASLRIDNILVVELIWQSTGTGNTDFGTVPTDTVLGDYLQMLVTHNMGIDQQFVVSAIVDQLSGPPWESYLTLRMNMDWFSWGVGAAAFGTSQDFTDYVGLSESFDQWFEMGIDVPSGQPNGTYEFEYAITLTSL
jgi:hypothetical protein